MSNVTVVPYDRSQQTIICYAPKFISTKGIWLGNNPLDCSLPTILLQLILIIFITRILVYVMKPLRQPRVVPEILGGIILGPSVLGRSITFADIVFPLRSVMIINTIANLALIFHFFLIALEMDLAVIKRTGRKAIIIAITGILLPFLVGVSFALLIHTSVEFIKLSTFILFVGVVLSVTAFPVLTRVLAELKLFNTEIGQISLSTALVGDFCAWGLLSFAIALAENDEQSSVSFWVILSAIVFVAFHVFIVRPLILWIIRTTPEGESVSELYLCLIICTFMISGFLADGIGMNSCFGAFMMGLIIPNGSLNVTLIERLEDFISTLMMPLFFVMIGLKVDIFTVNEAWIWISLGFVIILASIGKIAGTLLVSLYYKIPFYDGLTLGMLMNTKGLVEMIILNVGRDQKVLDTKSYTVMVIAVVVMTSLISPLVTIMYKPSRRCAQYKRRTMQRVKQEGEFRVLVCVHMPRNVPTIINLLESFHPNKKSPIFVSLLHLVELAGRASAMIISHNNTGSNRTQTQSDHIINAFENFQHHVNHVFVNSLIAVSPYSTIHEDIQNVAEEQLVAFIVIPFHKQQTVDGGMESTNPAFRSINQNVLDSAPCSVGILVDRGLSGSMRSNGSQLSHNVAVLFFGGPDDREALACGWRMSEHQNINLTVLRFLSGVSESSIPNSGDEILAIPTNEIDRERELDENYISEFRARTMMDTSIIYSERVVNHGEETVAAIRSIDSAHDLFIVGRGQGMETTVTAGLTDWSECPELGPIGDLLASSDVTARYSVLVVQQYLGIEAYGDWTVAQPGSNSQPENGLPRPAV